MQACKIPTSLSLPEKYITPYLITTRSTDNTAFDHRILRVRVGEGEWERGREEPWNPGRLEPWNPGTLEGWNPGTLEGWNPGTLETWKVGTLELEVPGTAWKVGSLEMEVPGTAWNRVLGA